MFPLCYFKYLFRVVFLCGFLCLMIIIFNIIISVPTTCNFYLNKNSWKLSFTKKKKIIYLFSFFCVFCPSVNSEFKLFQGYSWRFSSLYTGNKIIIMKIKFLKKNCFNVKRKKSKRIWRLISLVNLLIFVAFVLWLPK